jgi:threonine aldolase
VPPLVDLRSDTVTRPSEGVRRAMAAADVGDDVYGEDPAVNALEEQVAELFGHPAALFVPSGTMGNQIALRLLVPSADELLCDADAHVVRAELGAAAALAGVTTRTWSTPDGRFDADAVAAMSRPGAGPYFVSTAAVAVENTHNFGGGTIIPLHSMQRLRELTRPTGVTLHLDGARLWNAHVASGVPLATYGQLADTVSVCLSKGLGAPVGSLLASSKDRVAQARVWRKRLGGGMRQVGILAAAGLHALDHHVERLADDHARARRLADAVAAKVPDALDPSTVETNIVVIATADAPAVVARARDEGVLLSLLDPTHLRFVTHLDIGDDDVEVAAGVLVRALGA